MNIFNFDPNTILSLILTIMRVSIVLFMFPIFNSDKIPIPVKAAATLVITLAIWPHIALPGTQLPNHPFDVALMLAGEIVLGLVLGMCINFVFMGIQAGGELLGFQMGFSMINIADPLTGNQTGAVAFFLWMVSILAFLCLDGHLYMLQGFAMTFKLIPAGGVLIGEILLRQVFDLSTQLFVVALKIAAPVMVALFLVELTLALVSRTAPQVNIMEIGFPIKIAVGFFFVGLLLVIMAAQIEQFIAGLESLFSNLLRAGSPLFHTR